MGYNANIVINPQRPEILIAGPIQLVVTETGGQRIDLYIKNCGLGCFLLLVGEFGEAGEKGICDSKFHGSR